MQYNMEFGNNNDHNRPPCFQYVTRGYSLEGVPSPRHIARCRYRRQAGKWASNPNTISDLNLQRISQMFPGSQFTYSPIFMKIHLYHFALCYLEAHKNRQAIGGQNRTPPIVTEISIASERILRSY